MPEVFDWIEAGTVGGNFTSLTFSGTQRSLATWKPAPSQIITACSSAGSVQAN